MMKKLYVFVLAFLIYLILESIWLKLMNKNFYMAEVGDLMKSQPNLLPALLLFIVYISALCQLVIFPAGNQLDIRAVDIFLLGALFGAAAYATFDLTVLALFEGYSVKVAVVDIIWGSILTGSVAVSATSISRYMNWL